MFQDNMSLFALAKYTYKELLLEEYIQSKGLFKSRFIERYKHKQKLIKIKIIVIKVLYSIIFGILPILPVLTYMQIVDYLEDIPLSAENIFLTGSIFFGLYFVLQFFNFILMGLLESGILMSGSIFDWFETLPISRDKLHKLAYLTIFRTFDIPLIVIILGFPVIMLIMLIDTGGNLWIFFVCLGISILNTLLSFNLLILFGEKLSRILSSHQSNSKKATIIRMVTIIGYLIFILGSVYTVQWALNSLDILFSFGIYFKYAPLTNLILSLIPYPLNPSFLIAFMIDPLEATLFHWINIFLGLGLLILLTLWTYLKVTQTLNKITFTEHKNLKTITLKEPEIKIKKRSQIGAFLLKDLYIATHDLKIFMSTIMPIILSCIFSFSFNLNITSGPIFLERDIFFNWIGLMIFMPIIISMLVYGIVDIDISGESILASLPVDRRSQAKAKIILLLIPQTFAVLTPCFIYIKNPKFLILLCTSIISLPLIWLMVILTFELKILYFGQKKNYTDGKYKYIINELNPENKLLKWAYIVSVQYIISFWLISLAYIFFMLQIFISFLWVYVLVIFMGFISVIILFNRMFPITKKPRYKVSPDISQYKQRYLEKWDIKKIPSEPKRHFEGKPTMFTNYPWISIMISFLLFLLTVIWSRHLIFPFLYRPYFEITNILKFFLYNLFFIVLICFIIPNILGIPSGRMPLKEYLTTIKAASIKYLLWGIVGVFALYIFNFIIVSFYYSTNYMPYGFYYVIFEWIVIASQIIWNELFFRGILLSTLQKNRRNNLAIFLNVIISSLFSLFALFLFQLFDEFDVYFNFHGFLLYLILLVGMNIILGYLSIRINSILPGILLLLILSAVGFPISSVILQTRLFI